MYLGSSTFIGGLLVYSSALNFIFLCKLLWSETLNSVSFQVIRFFLRLLQVGFKEFIYCVGVPFGDTERFNDISFLVEKFNLWVETAKIFDLKILEFVWPFGLDEGLDLWVGSKLACADFENCFWILFRSTSAGLFLAAFNALFLDFLDAKDCHTMNKAAVT